MKINYDVVYRLIDNFIRNSVNKTGIKKVVLGLSGGIDSSVVAYLLVHSIGKENVKCVFMPYKTSSPSSREDAELVVNELDVEYEEIDITPQIDAYFSRIKDADNLCKGNKMARERMSILYDISQREKRLVIGTSNKTELLIGYSTIFGDNAYAINPIGDLYKTWIFELARYMGLPERIINKKPSADLWEGQSDEDEIGMTYERLDRILIEYVENRKRLDEIVKITGESRETVDRVLRMVRNSQYKRTMPQICKITERSIPLDFIYPRDWYK